MIPFTPHLAYESLDILSCNNKNSWPELDENETSTINLTVQINGKTRDNIRINKNLSEDEVKELVIKISKAKKFLINKETKKIIFVKNRIINYII